MVAEIERRVEVVVRPEMLWLLRFRIGDVRLR